MLIAGVGNVFRSDDGFGCEVVRGIDTSSLPDGVRVVDYGTGGLHLAYDLADGVDRLILVDAVADAGGPGRVVVLETTLDEHRSVTVDGHGMDPATVLRTVRQLGGEPPPTIVVGCEPATLDDGMGLSERVAAAVEPARAKVLELAAEQVS